MPSYHSHTYAYSQTFHPPLYTHSTPTYIPSHYSLTCTHAHTNTLNPSYPHTCTHPLHHLHKHPHIFMLLTYIWSYPHTHIHSRPCTSYAYTHLHTTHTRTLSYIHKTIHTYLYAYPRSTHLRIIHIKYHIHMPITQCPLIHSHRICSNLCITHIL